LKATTRYYWSIYVANFKLQPLGVTKHI